MSPEEIPGQVSVDDVPDIVRYHGGLALRVSRQYWIERKSKNDTVSSTYFRRRKAHVAALSTTRKFFVLTGVAQAC